MTIEFFIDCDPPTATAQERKVKMGRYPIFYDPDSVKYARELLTLHLRQHRPPRPLSGPVELTVAWSFRARTHKPGTWRDTKPDTDNLQKLLKDVMTREHFWNDDAQVCKEIVTKRWEKRPGILIIAREL